MVAGLRAAPAAHRIVTASEARQLEPEYGTIGLHPLCGGLSPDVAWPYLRRAVGALEDR